MNRRKLLRAGVALAVLPFGMSARAQQGWPTKAMKLVNPFPAGGGTDVFARPIAAKIGTSLGQTLFIENLGGAAGTLGAGIAAKAVPDGYTFFVGAIHHTIAESLYTKRARRPGRLLLRFAQFLFAADQGRQTHRARDHERNALARFPRTADDG
ncbi:MAG: tripartite tricarboxylate transporter substrate-binding protein [Usitatibacteraceae bacterium]